MTDDLELALRTALAADPAIAAAVTAADGTVCIYPIVLKQRSAFPAITFMRVSTSRNAASGSYTHDAPAAGYTGLGWARLQITIWSDEFGDLAPLVKAVAQLIRRTDFADFAHPANTILLDHSSQEPERNLYRRDIDAKLWFKETP